MIRSLFLLALLLLAAPARAQLSFPDFAPAHYAERMEQLAAGNGSLLAVVRLDAGRDHRGDLLDPRTVRAAYEGEPCTVWVSYKLPHLAVVSILPPAGAFERHRSGLLTAQARTLRSEEVLSGTLRLEVPEQTTATLAFGRVRLLDAAGEPMPGALVFGQRNRMLLARANSGGFVRYDSNRQSHDPHVALAAGYWAQRYDARTSDSVRLAPLGVEVAAAIRKGGGASTVALEAAEGKETGTATRLLKEIRLQRQGGGTPPVALLEVAGRYWLSSDDGVFEDVLVPAGQDCDVVLVAPGCLPTRLRIEPGRESYFAMLPPMPTSATTGSAIP